MSIGDQLTSLQTVFTRRFLFNALLPTSVVASFVTVIVANWTGTWHRISTAWADGDALTKIVMAGTYFSLMWLFSVAIASQWRGIVRLYEGYPLVAGFERWGRGRLAPGVLWHRKRMTRVTGENKSAWDGYYFYPPPQHASRILPTTLGNILLAAERYPEERYGIEAIVFWPRLFPLLPEQFKQDYEEFVRDYEFPLVLSFLLNVGAAVSATTALLTKQLPAAFVVTVSIFLLGSFASYRMSLSGALQMAEQQRVAFDLYRGRILDAWPTVRDVHDEKEAFDAVKDFIVLNAPANWGDAQNRRLLRKSRTVGGRAQPGR